MQHSVYFDDWHLRLVLRTGSQFRPTDIVESTGLPAFHLFLFLCLHIRSHIFDSIRLQIFLPLLPEDRLPGPG